MILLRKLASPEILLAKGAEWTAEYLAAKTAGERVSETVRFRYRHADVKATLHEEAHSKCVYCETRVSVGETDHILPVKERPELLCSWENLALCCKECNRAKGSYFSATEPLVNPFVDDPDKHLLFFGPLVLHRSGDDKGLRTAVRLELSRPDLLERRSRRIVDLMPLVDRWKTHEQGETKKLLWQLILKEAADESEYAATVRAYLFNEFGIRVPSDTDVPEAA